MALQYAAIFIHNSLSSHIHMRQTHHAHVLTHIVGTLHTTQPTHTVSPPASMGVSRVKQDGNLHVQGETLTHKQRTHTTNHSPSPSAIHTSPRNLPWGGALYPPNPPHTQPPSNPLVHSRTTVHEGECTGGVCKGEPLTHRLIGGSVPGSVT